MDKFGVIEQRWGREHTKAISAIEDEYDRARYAAGGALGVDETAQYTFRIMEQEELYAEQMKAVRLAEVIAPQMREQLQDGLPEKVIPYDRKSDIAYSVERELRNACPADEILRREG